MQIVTVTNNLSPGGVNRTAATFAKYYVRAGVESVVCLLESPPLAHHDYDFEASLAAEGVPVLRLAPSHDARTDVGHRRPLAALSPDVVHLHAHRLPDAGVRALRARWPKALFVEKNVWGRPSQFEDLLDISFSMTKWCALSYLIRTRNHSVIVRELPNPQDFTWFRAASGAGPTFRTAKGIPEDAILLGRVGQPNVFKWSPLVVDAFHAVAWTRPDLWLLLVGAPDDIQRAVAELPASINSRVRCIDRLYERELAACYAALDIFVHAARHGESFGNVLCEAMFSGVAVLTLATPEVDNGQAQLVRDAGGGVIAYSEAGFMKALEALCERPDWRRELAQRGRSGVERCFGAEQIIDAALRFFVNEVARRKKAVAARNNGAERSRECARWKEEAAATMSECWEGDMAKTVGWIRARAIAERAVGRSRWETMARLVRGYRLHR